LCGVGDPWRKTRQELLLLLKEEAQVRVSVLCVSELSSLVTKR
jgi:hypothetical protein